MGILEYHENRLFRGESDELIKQGLERQLLLLLRADPKRHVAPSSRDSQH